MKDALWRKVRADIQSNRLQFALIGGVLTLSAMLLTISLLVMGSAEDPWNRTFDATNGPHIWLVSHQHDLDFTPVMEDPAVSETSDVFMALAENPLVLGDEMRPLFLYEMDTLPQVAHPLVAEGEWLDAAQLDEVVLDYSLARYYDFTVGDEVTVLAADGNHTLKVVGLAVTAHWFPYNDITKDSSPGVAYISRATLEAIQPDPAWWYAVLAIRLHDPEASREFGEALHERYPGALRSVLDWHFTKENALLANTLNVMFMGLFSILGLAAVGMIIFNTIGGQVLSQFREIGLLKALGLTPGQVVTLLLGEHLFIGLIAALAGIVGGLVVSPGLISTLAENLNTTLPNIYAPGPLIAVLLIVEGAVALATLLPPGRQDASTPCRQSPSATGALTAGPRALRRLPGGCACQLWFC
jgi:putative ABC transport system permease protein